MGKKIKTPAGKTGEFSKHILPRINNDVKRLHWLRTAALIAVGFSLVSLDRTDRRKTQFVFKREPDMELEIEAYWSKELQVPALAYFDTLKMLKNRLYSTD